jgi:hypothetical protein
MLLKTDLRTTLTSVQSRLESSSHDADFLSNCSTELAALGTEVTAMIEVEFSKLVETTAA